MAASIKHQLFFQHPPEAVWQYLTSAEFMELWLMKSDFQPIMGHEFTFRSNPVPSFDWNGIVYCKVLEIVPFKKLSYSWKLGPGDGTINVVEYEIDLGQGKQSYYLYFFEAQLARWELPGDWEAVADEIYKKMNG